MAVGVLNTGKWAPLGNEVRPAIVTSAMLPTLHVSQGGIQASVSYSDVKWKGFWFSFFYVLFALSSFRFILAVLTRKVFIASCGSGAKYLGEDRKVKDKYFINLCK